MAKLIGEHAVELENAGGNIIKPHTSAYNILVTLALCLGSINYGYSSNVISGALALPSFNNLFLATDLSPRTGAILGVFLGGGIIGAILQQPLSDLFGRRIGMGSGACFVILGGALQAGAVTFPMFVVARCLTGIGSAISFTVTPMFISELAPAHSRGFLVSLHVVGMNAGYIISGFASLGFSYMTDEIQWRLSFIINAVVGILLLLALFFVPESPRWLITKGRFEEAKCTLDRLHINKYDLQGFTARAELYQIKAQVQADKDLPRGYLHILRTPTLRKRAYCTILVWFTSMGTGVLVISFFTPLLFAGLGYGSKKQFGLSIAYFALCAVSAFLGGLAVDRVGRRIYCVIGAGGCILTLVVEAAVQATYINTTNKSGLAAGVAFFFLFGFFYNAFYDNGSFVYSSEIWPTHLRGEGVTIAMVTLYLLGIAYSSPASLAFGTIGWKYYLVFICVSAVNVVVLWLYLPETTGLTLEEIGEQFGEKAQVHFRGIDLQATETKTSVGQATITEEI